MMEPTVPNAPSANIEPLEAETFRFSCHPGVSCFGACCSDLTLMLLPYDVLRLRRRLGLGSREFLDTYTETLEGDGGVPRVQLRMGDDEQRSCPFVDDGACTVYEDRPGACRMFPLGRAATAGRVFPGGPGGPGGFGGPGGPGGPGGRGRPGGPGVKVPASGPPEGFDSPTGPGGASTPGSPTEGSTGSPTQERFFLVREPVCNGFAEATAEWDVRRFIEDQGAGPYLAQNDAWLPVFTRLPALARDPHAEQRFSVFHTAAYDLDRFRDLATGEAFTSRFALDPAELERLRYDDEALLSFAIRWLRFALFGEPTMQL